MNDAISHFVLNSCPFVIIFPLIVFYTSYQKLSKEDKENSKISFNTFAILFPILFGCIFALVYGLISFIPRKTNSGYYLRYAISGPITAIIMTLLLHYVFNIYEDWLHLFDSEIDYCHIIVIVFYTIFYLTIGYWLRIQVLYGGSSGSSAPSGLASSSGSHPSPRIPNVSNPFTPRPNPVHTNVHNAPSTKFDEIQAKVNSSK